MKKICKGFTIIELVTIITIIIILSIIAFLEVKSFAADARNSKRISDIKKIENNMLTAQSKGNTFLSLINPVQTKQIETGATLGGTGIIVGFDYSAGIPNYTTLGIKENDIKDPNGNYYNIGLTTKYNGKYELASIMEKGTIKSAYILGNYVPRIKQNQISANSINSLSGSNYIELNDVDINNFFVNDYINAGTGTTAKRIINIIHEENKIILESPFEGGDHTINLGNSTFATPDIQGLITASGTNNTIIRNNQMDYLPY